LDQARGNAAHAHAKTTRPRAALTQPIYFDVVYIPHLGSRLAVSDDEASATEFFSLIRSRFYVLSSTECSGALLDGWLKAKRNWKVPDARSELIPTYDNDILSIWLREHEHEIVDENMDVKASASRCQIKLVGAESDSCAAYKIEL